MTSGITAQFWLPAALSVASLLIGALFSWIIADFYARRAARLAQRQSEVLGKQLRALTALLVTAEEQGHLQLQRDAEGNISNLRFDRTSGHSET